MDDHFVVVPSPGVVEHREGDDEVPDLIVTDKDLVDDDVPNAIPEDKVNAAEPDVDDRVLHFGHGNLRNIREERSRRSRFIPSYHAYLLGIHTFVDRISGLLWNLNTFMHKNPELAYHEYKAHDILTKFMRSRDGWVVTTSAYGIKTAWTAVYDSGKPGPTVAFNVEMDALPGLGHACGHNLIASASLAASLATVNMIQRHRLAGRVVVVGTPGEEGHSGAKIKLLGSGAYAGVDACLISHPSIFNNSAMVRTTAFARLDASYTGRPALGSRDAVNALDALVLAYTALSALRGGDDSVGLHITHAGDVHAPIETTDRVPLSAACTALLRSSTAAGLARLVDRASACFRGGAVAVGAELDLVRVPGYMDHVPNRVLAASYSKCWIDLPDVPLPPVPPNGAMTHVKASTDQGDLSHAMPSINVSFAIPPGPERGPPHTRDFERAAGTREAFHRAMRVGKAMAGAATELLEKKGMVEEVKKQWKRDMEEGASASTAVKPARLSGLFLQQIGR